MKHQVLAAVVVGFLCAPVASTEVVIETVTVGNPGNAGENSGESEPGGWGPNRICGGVDYVYNIGRFEVTASQYTEFLNAVARADTYGLYNELMFESFGRWGCNIQRGGTRGSYIYTVSPDWADRPVNFVSWGDAARFANWLHNGQPGLGAPTPQDKNSTEDGSYFLNGATSDSELLAIVREPDATWVIPSEDEWYKAAYHTNDGVTAYYFDYPTSGDIAPRYIGDGESAPDPDPGSYATYDGDHMVDGIGPPYYRTKVGEHENSGSPYGTFDQGGNVWEWNETLLFDSDRGIRGGSFSLNELALRATYRNYRYYPTKEINDIGFRVAELPDCNNNGIPDHCDLDCGSTDGPCDVEGCGQSSDTDGDGVPDECELAVYLDIKPGSCPNPVEPRSHGVVSVGVIGSESLDVTQIDTDSLTLKRTDGVGGAVTPISGPPGPGIAIKDVTTPFPGDLCDCHELGGDGIDDLQVKFSTPELVDALELGSGAVGTSVVLTVSGSLLDGTTFEASDCIVIPGKRSLKPLKARTRRSRK